MIRLLPPNGFAGRAAFWRKGNDSGPCISSRCGLWTFEPDLPLALSAEDTVFFFIALEGKFAASPYFFVPA